MIEIKLAGAVLAAVSAALLGFTLGNDLKQRIEFLQNLQKGLIVLHQEMEYRKAPLEEALQYAGNSLTEPLSSFFRETGIRLEKLPGAPFFSVWEEMADWYLSEAGQKKEDLELIRQLGMQLSGLETEGNSGLLKIYEQRLQGMIVSAKEEYAGKAQLYQRLGILGGIFLVLLFF
ncbi:MAG: stage III sporulation protein AB [Lachnospiraceae bacterium]|nr:stage III sporulation protein AB [Lachnospiraceae bacterium]